MLNMCINIEALDGKKHGVDDLSQHRELQDVKPLIIVIQLIKLVYHTCDVWLIIHYRYVLSSLFPRDLFYDHKKSQLGHI